MFINVQTFVHMMYLGTWKTHNSLEWGFYTRGENA